MSVLARMRKLSQYEFYVNALKLRKSMRFLLLRDLGIKDKVREVHEFAKDMSEDDRVEFILLASKYNVVKRQRHKMRKLAKLASEGTISLKDFQTQYKSWRGDKKRYHAYYTLRRLDSEEKELAEWIRNTRSTQMA